MTVSDFRTGPDAPLPRRIAVLSFHTSPLAQPGTGDAGGLNVYVLQSARRLARRGVEVEIFTRATHSSQPAVEQAGDGVLVRNIVAGPFEGLRKEDLPTQLCPFVAGVMRAEAGTRPGTTTSSTRTIGCRDRPGWWPPSTGGCRWCTPRTPWPR